MMRPGTENTHNALRQRIVLAACIALTILMVTSDAYAQAPGDRTMGRNGWRWQPPGAQGIYSGNRSTGTTVIGVGPTYYGTGYPFYGYGVPIGYGIGYGVGSYGYGVDYGFNGYGAGYSSEGSEWVRSMAVKADAQAALDYEKARHEYIKNRAEYLRLRKAQLDETANRKADDRARRIKTAQQKPRKKPTDIYDRLSAEELNVATGKIVWPPTLLSDEFSDARAKVEQLTRKISVDGVTEADAQALRNLCNAMKRTTNVIIDSDGFSAYSSARRFLGQLSVEGYYALEEK